MANSRNNATLDNGNMSAFTTIVVLVVSLFIVVLIFAGLAKVASGCSCDATGTYYSLRALSCRPCV